MQKGPFQYKDAVVPVWGIPIINIRRSHDRLISIMVIRIPGKTVLKPGPGGKLVTCDTTRDQDVLLSLQLSPLSGNDDIMTFLRHHEHKYW